MNMKVKEKPWFWISVLILWFFPHYGPSIGFLTSISANQSLSGDQTLISRGGFFELGFFNPGNNSKYYIGIWYKQISQKTYVWVANRDKPVSEKYSAKLAVSGANLVLFDQSQTMVWSTNLISSTSSFVEAILEDSGNLVLRNRFNKTELLWQSFDYPTDTWLPGGKIRFDKKTKQSQYLTSWKNSEDPGEGLFSLELDPNGSTSCHTLWNKSVKYWTSGPWSGDIFSFLFEMRLNHVYNLTFVSNEDESYLTYTMHNNTTISRLLVDFSGQIRQYSWLEPSQQWNLFWSEPRQQCEVYAFCGAFAICSRNSLTLCSCLPGFKPKFQSDWNLNDYSGGCVRKTKLQCEDSNSSKGKTDRFLAMSKMALPNLAQSVQARDEEECKSTCLINCSCVAYAHDNKECSIWHYDLLSLQQYSQVDSCERILYLKLAASEFSDSMNIKRMITGIFVGMVSGIGVLLASFLFVMMRRRNKLIPMGDNVEGSLTAFGYRDLQSATKNFSEKLGGGGFGSVFKGTLPDSSVIAVKKLESISQGEKQFRTEVRTIGIIQHVNLIWLRGFCSKGARKLLVYDYMPNGSLDSHIFQEKNHEILGWKMRYQIALGIAKGLTYLHEECRDCIIHCDIKPENILLDVDFCPKVADFGLAKLVERDFSRVLTTMRGTRGYLAPEWIRGGYHI